ncbi:uncharacterized protein apof [Austrofundulus limnaeus]|uniref:Uncharacterized protein apof n=1 Tax=Austrofundulus limnaeus TaxID=52670 RepID=A0A2I4BA30_AUSLI|nr:PREDICTED: apolipoprotein F [Austrofundulus limnaeus]
MNGIMFSKCKWLIVIQLLLTEQALCRAPPSLVKRDTLLQENHAYDDAENKLKLDLHPQPSLSPTNQSEPESPVSQEEERVQSAGRVTSFLRAKLQDHLHIEGNISCEELLSGSTMDDPLSSVVPRELLGLSLVPVLAVAGCPEEAQTLVLKLYDLLGEADTEELLMELEALIERKMSRSTSAPASPAPPSERDEESRRLDAVMFNIQQLALKEEGTSPQEGHCEGWTRVNGTRLVGTPVKGSTGGLKDAVSSCERLGALCAGVRSGGPLLPGLYQAVLKTGSRIFPSTSTESECWIRHCSTQEDDLITTASGQRTRRSPRRSCINKNEERVYNVMEWIPGVSTLYNLGTAVYYASVNCPATAKERAILSAVDLGTDALMVATGGTAGVAGYALGAGVKTGVKAGVKYLINNMKEEDDVLVNQSSWERSVFTVQ